MKCDKCRNKDAILNIIKISNGDEKTLWLCGDCAKELMQISAAKDDSDEGKVQSVLTGFLQALNTSKKISEIEKIVCENCGFTYKDFKNSGKLGCENCYEVFKTQIRPVIKRVHGDLEHIGKIPKKSGAEVLKNKTVKKLKIDLQKAIIEEEYEKAAIIRDEIKAVEKSGGEDI